MGYVQFPIASNPATLQQSAIDYIKSRSPLWEPHDDNLDTWIIQIMASHASDLRELASTIPDTIFRYFGDTILGIPPFTAVAATLDSTWTSIDDKGYLIPAGTLVGIRDGSGILRGFRVVNDTTILPGLTSTNVGEVGLIATEPGTASTDIGGPGTEAELIQSLTFVGTIMLEGFAAGGVDDETTVDYMNRLVDYMRGLSTRPILPEDYARLARGVPGVYRAVAIDGYDPANDTYFNERMVTVAGIDQEGQDLSSESKSNLDDLLQAQREVNFLVHVIDASRTTINVTFVAKALPGYSTVDVEAQAIADVTQYLDPANWGFDKAAGADTTRSWVETLYVRYNNVVSVIENVLGIEYVVSMTMNRQGSAPGIIDIPLDSPAALTVPGTIDGTVIN